MPETHEPELQDWLRRYYGEVLSKSDDLATNACCASAAPPAQVAAALARVHERVVERFYGCGHPFAEALEGKTVLDLGCGAGRDVYVLAQLVGPKGRVIGIDMTPEQLEIARELLPWHMERFGYAQPNVELLDGLIEDLSALDDESVDVVVSNCVINLSPRKDRVLAEAGRVLRPGGELHFADVLADRRLPEAVSRDPVLYAECLGGALYDGDVRAMARAAGFLDPREQASAPIEILGEAVRARVGAASFRAVTLRLFKLADLDERCEDYGQVATYLGGLPDSEARFVLDDHHVFEAGRPERVCGNTASMLADTRLAPWFRVDGDRSVHHGVFPCTGTIATAQAATATGAACCP